MLFISSLCIAVAAAQSLSSTEVPTQVATSSSPLIIPSSPPSISAPISVSISAPSSTSISAPASASPTSAASSLLPAQLVGSNTTAYIERLRKRWGVTGIAVAIVASPQFTNQSSWSSQLLSFGNATATSRVTNETIFGLGSNSKLFTALAIELLVANHTAIPGSSTNATLSFSTKIKDLLPEWRLQDQYASDHVDITDLLTMRSGMPRHDLSYESSSAEELVSNMRNLRPSAEIRQAFQYNNMHYVALALVVSHLSGVAFEDFIQQNILTPVGMKHTYYNSFTALQTGLCSDAYSSKGVNITHCAANFNLTNLDPACFGTPESVGWWTPTDGLFIAGAGAVSSNAQDMALWLQELLSPRVLPSAIVRDVGLGRQASGDPPLASQFTEQMYGYGQFTYSYRGAHLVGHTGGVPGFSTMVMRLPERGIGISVLVNGDSGVFDLIGNRIIDTMLGLDPIDWESQVLLGLLIPPPIPTAPPNATDPTVPFSSIPGNYSNAGYGPMPLRLLSVAELATDAYLPLHTLPINLDRPAFVAEFNHTFANRLVLTHFDGPYFNVSALFIYPDVTTVVGAAPAVVNSEGFGVWGIWGQGSTVPQRPVATENVQEACEVWFAKAQP